MRDNKNIYIKLLLELDGGYITSSGACTGDFGGPLYVKEKSAFVLTGEVIIKISQYINFTVRNCLHIAIISNDNVGKQIARHPLVNRILLSISVCICCLIEFFFVTIVI